MFRIGLWRGTKIINCFKRQESDKVYFRSHVHVLQLHGGFRVRVRVSVRVLFRQTLDEWMGPKVHFFPRICSRKEITYNSFGSL